MPAAPSLLVLSPQAMAEQRGAIARVLSRRLGGGVVELGGPDASAGRVVRSAGQVLVVMGDAPGDLAQGLALVRWAAGQRLGVPLGIVLLAQNDSRAHRRRVRVTIESHSGRRDLVVGSMRTGRVDRSARRVLGRLLSRLQSQWHPVCGGVDL